MQGDSWSVHRNITNAKKLPAAITAASLIGANPKYLHTQNITVPLPIHAVSQFHPKLYGISSAKKSASLSQITNVPSHASIMKLINGTFSSLNIPKPEATVSAAAKYAGAMTFSTNPTSTIFPNV